MNTVAQIPPVTEFYFQRDVSYSDCASNRAFIEPPPALANIARICVIARLARISDAKGKRLIPTESSETNSSERTRNEYLRCICRVFFFSFALHSLFLLLLLLPLSSFEHRRARLFAKPARTVTVSMFQFTYSPLEKRRITWNPMEIAKAACKYLTDRVVD